MVLMIPFYTTNCGCCVCFLALEAVTIAYGALFFSTISPLLSCLFFCLQLIPFTSYTCQPAHLLIAVLCGISLSLLFLPFRLDVIRLLIHFSSIICSSPLVAKIVVMMLMGFGLVWVAICYGRDCAVLSFNCLPVVVVLVESL